MLTTSQLRPRVAIQGVAGAFHEIAARHYHAGRLTPNIEVVAAETFEDVVQCVESRQADSGVMAIENTIAGSIFNNYKLLNNSTLHITGEIYLRIRQNLMALQGQTVADLREVHSHPVALQQCEAFFSRHPHLKLVEASDTALVARDIQAQQWRGIAAVGSYLAAEMYQLHILAPSIETYKKNFTRFLILNESNLENETAIADFNKISLVFSAAHTVGSLHQILGKLAQHGANLTKIQSMPLLDSQWEYQFFVDFMVAKAEDFYDILTDITPLTNELRVLGRYAAGAYFE